MPKISGFADFLVESEGNAIPLDWNNFGEMKDEVNKKSWALSSLIKTESLKKFANHKGFGTHKNARESSFFIIYDTLELQKIEEFIEKNCELNILPLWSEEFNGIEFFQGDKVKLGSAEVKNPYFGNDNKKFTCEYNADSIDTLAESIDSAFDDLIKNIQSVRIVPQFKDKGRIPIEMLKPLISAIQKYYKKSVYEFFREGKKMEESKPSLYGFIVDLINENTDIIQYFPTLPLEIQQGLVDSKEFSEIKDQKTKTDIEKQLKAQKLLKYL